MSANSKEITGRNDTDALQVDDCKLVSGGSSKSAIIAAQGLAISKAKRDMLSRKAKSAIALMREVLNELEEMK